MKNILVFFGGRSVEHDISLITGVMTANSIDKERYNAIPILVDSNGLWFTGKSLLDLDEYKNLNLKKLKRVCLLNGQNTLYEVKKNKLKKLESIFMAINCMHGGYGEDGCLSGLLKMCDIPICSPLELPSSIAIDKSFTKLVMKSLGVLTVNGELVKDKENLDSVVKKLGFPLIVKPNFLGSSIGVSKVHTKEQLEKAVDLALKYGNSALVERCLEKAVEINCACYFDGEKVVVSECEKPVSASEFLTFSEKYASGKRVFPADIDKKVSEKIKKITKKVYESLNFTGVIRIDFFLHEDKVYLNEINAVPGSLAYYLFSDTLKGFTEMLNKLILATEKEYLLNQGCIRVFKSNVLSGVGAKGAKRL